MSALKTRAFVYLTIASLIWGFASVVIKLTFSGFEPLLFLFYRFFFSAVIAIPFLVTGGLPRFKSLRDFLYIVVYGLFSTSAALLFLFEGLSRTTVLTLSIVTIIAPLMVMISGHFVFHEKISKRQKRGIILAFLGALCTVIEPIFSSSLSFGSVSGNLFLLGYLVFDVVALLILKYLLRHRYSSLAITNFSFLIGFVSLIPAVFLIYSLGDLVQTVISTPVQYHLGVIYMALFSGSIAYTLRGIGQKTVSIADASVFGYLVAVFSAIFALFILHETPTPLFLVGGVLITIGIVVTELRK